MGTIWGYADFLCERPFAAVLATIDGVSPRRITAMRLCARATRGYQSDSSSKRPTAFVSLESVVLNVENGGIMTSDRLQTRGGRGPPHPLAAPALALAGLTNSP